MNRILIAAGILLSIPCAVVNAQQNSNSPPPPPRTPQPRGIANGLDPQRVVKAGDEAPGFDELDKDHHGFLKRSDLPADEPALKQLRMHFRDYDYNKDARITPDEYGEYLRR
jgi:hypothetical protein